MPILVDGAGVVLAGHARLMAAHNLGLAEVPVVIADHLDGGPSEGVPARGQSADRARRLGSRRVARRTRDLHDIGFDLKVTGFDLSDFGQIRMPDPSVERDAADPRGTGNAAG